MSIFVNWTDYHNTGSSEYTLLRYDGIEQTGTPIEIGRFPNNVFTYTDSNVVLDKIYTYVIISTTALGPVRSRGIVGVSLAALNGPFNRTVLAGNFNWGMMDYIRDPISLDLRGAAEQKTLEISNVPGTILRATYGTNVATYSSFDLIKCVRNGSVFFMPADYGVSVPVTTIAHRTLLENNLKEGIQANKFIVDNGYRLKWDLMTVEEFETFYASSFGGKANQAGFIPRVCDKPPAAHPSHCQYARNGNELVRYVLTQTAPILVASKEEAKETDAFIARTSYPNWVLRPM